MCYYYHYSSVYHVLLLSPIVVYIHVLLLSPIVVYIHVTCGGFCCRESLLQYAAYIHDEI